MRTNLNPMTFAATIAGLNGVWGWMRNFFADRDVDRQRLLFQYLRYQAGPIPQRTGRSITAVLPSYRPATSATKLQTVEQVGKQVMQPVCVW